MCVFDKGIIACPSDAHSDHVAGSDRGVLQRPDQRTEWMQWPQWDQVRTTNHHVPWLSVCYVQEQSIHSWREELPKKSTNEIFLFFSPVSFYFSFFFFTRSEIKCFLNQQLLLFLLMLQRLFSLQSLFVQSPCHQYTFFWLIQGMMMSHPLNPNKYILNIHKWCLLLLMFGFLVLSFVASKEIMTIMLPPGVPAINPRIYQGPPLYSTVMSFMMAMINCRRLLLLLFSAWMTRRRALLFILLAKFIPRVNINICAHKQQRKSPYTPAWLWGYGVLLWRKLKLSILWA